MSLSFDRLLNLFVLIHLLVHHPLDALGILVRTQRDVLRPFATVDVADQHAVEELVHVASGADHAHVRVELELLQLRPERYGDEEPAIAPEVGVIGEHGSERIEERASQLDRPVSAVQTSHAPTFIDEFEERADVGLDCRFSVLADRSVERFEGNEAATGRAQPGTERRVDTPCDVEQRVCRDQVADTCLLRPLDAVVHDERRVFRRHHVQHQDAHVVVPRVLE